MTHETAQKFLAELPGVRNDLPFSPVLLQKLFMQTGEGALASMHDIAETIAKDQGLTAKLLAMANSAFYGLQAQVTTVQRAATVLGLREIRNIVLAIGIRALGRKRPMPKEFDLDAYWRHQFRVACLSRDLARALNRQEGGGLDPDQLFTAGLLHDLGKLIVAMFRPEVAVEMLTLARTRHIPESLAENDYWGVDHGVVGALVLGSWDLPAEIVEPVNWHHAPELAPVSAREATLLALADALAHEAADPADPQALPAPGLAQSLGLSLEDVRPLAATVLADESVDQFVQNLV
ncbi:MAG TPA: HDOD domain-containing protein [Desulfovibrio sp.]|jgi:putative nucleotidyltransferase with HDIG domain|uniref:HDOD domain-containing protein n=1 Tax=Desulfovibrio TaxID=872 RepID=UPI00040EE500|nr:MULTISPECIES: HDOD domain-containing protein [Desulfovibrio]MDY0304924.1 HDOD domain-containing protein [Desulfovibrionaceae bacterium]HMM38796.1 HDOD domain-containing protein [Desulfovibrio sp.]